ncbi:hypothetical protein FOCG_10458 [Fusarium oxysporum f. sp. radicis-lycopersici 26381]|uniref:Uncharacterized protein n=1 Tax=Fusarium oxysporum TaxID=5507 RepID=A0A8H5EF36_FUSOX|nr:hypothetical protein FOCG_10458 [Fusarium oxysporum f. sp. radicis-lycopersici 26381]KAF5256431.1 hypothetical protein FOXYS1_13094 [Fusarium oxysporum]
MRNVFDKWEATEIPMVASRDNRLVLSRMSPVSLEKAGEGLVAVACAHRVLWMRSIQGYSSSGPVLVLYKRAAEDFFNFFGNYAYAIGNNVTSPAAQTSNSDGDTQVPGLISDMLLTNIIKSVLILLQAMEIMALPTTTSPTVLIPFNFHTHNHHYHIYNGLVIPTPSGGYVGVTSDGVKIEHAMRSMEETGAASVTVGLYYQDSTIRTLVN